MKMSLRRHQMLKKELQIQLMRAKISELMVLQFKKSGKWVQKGRRLNFSTDNIKHCLAGLSTLSKVSVTQNIGQALFLLCHMIGIFGF